MREVREELGIAPPIGRLLVHAWINNPGTGAQILYVFDGGTLGPDDLQAITRREGELSDYRFHNPIDADDSLVPPHLKQVWEQTLAAHHGDRIIFVSPGH